MIVTEVPTGAEFGDRLVMLGDGPVTVKLYGLLASPATVTTRLPVVAPFGTFVLIPDADQLFTVAGVPLKATVLLPWLAPNPPP